MGALQATVFFLFLLKACEINAQNEDWKTATATYSKETNGSIITGTFLASIVSKFVTLLSFTTKFRTGPSKNTSTYVLIGRY